MAYELKCGVHLGQGDTSPQKAREILGENAIIGATVKTLKQAKIAKTLGVNYLGIEAVFPTNSKKDAMPLSITELKNICKNIDLPVYAIFGIDEKYFTLKRL